MAYLDKSIIISDEATNAINYLLFANATNGMAELRTDSTLSYNPATDTLSVNNLMINGTTTTVNTETLNIADNFMLLNSNISGVPAEDAGIEINRGSSSNVKLLWNEATDRWTFTNNGSTFYNVPIPGEYSATTGTVTSVGLAMPSIFTVSGSPVSGSGTLTAALASQTANTFFAAPNGAAGTPTFRAIVAADIPILNQNTTGASGSVTNALTLQIKSGTTEGTDKYTFNGSAVKGLNFLQGTNVILTASAGGLTIASTDTTHTSFAWTGGTTSGPTGSLTGTAATVSYAAIPSASVTASGVVTTGPQEFSGTKVFNSSVSTQDGISLVGRAGGTSSFNVALTPATLTAARTITLPDATGVLALTSSNITGTSANVTGTVAVANGGTGTTSTIQGGVVYGASTTAHGTTAAGSVGQVLKSNGTSAPTWVTLDMTYMPDSVLKKSVKAATTADLGSASVTTTTLVGPLVVFPSIDGIAIVLGDRVLVKNQTLSQNNGIYSLTTVGTAGTVAWVLTRVTGADSVAEVAGAIVNVDSGTQGGILYSNNFKITDTLGTTPMPWYAVLNSLYSGATNVTTLGTIATGTWSATTIATTKGGTGTTTAPVAGGIIFGASTSAYGSTAVGTSGQVLISNAAGTPTWASPSTLGAGSVANSVTFNNGGAGDASGAAYNGSAAKTVSYNTIGAAASAHTHSAFDRATALLTGAVVFSDIVVTDGITTSISTRSLTYGDVGAAASGHTHSYAEVSTSLTGNTTAAANGQLMIGDGADFVKATLTGGQGITITNGAGAITISQRESIAEKTAAYTLLDTDSIILCDSTAATFSITLPAAPPVGTVYRVKKVDASANGVTIDAGAGKVIDGAQTFFLGFQYQAIDVIYAKANTWYIL